MNKQKLIKAIQAQLEKDLDAMIESARATLEAATNEESKPENEYDTRSLEASYLAGAQAQRAAEIEEVLLIYKNLEVKDFPKGSKISSTALVEVECNNKKSWVFLMSKGGGLILHHEGSAVQVVTPNSPLGEALLGLAVGDTAIVEAGGKAREYDILRIL